MANKIPVGINEIAQRIDVNNPYTYVAKVQLTSNTDSKSAEILLDSSDFWAADILVTAIDADGQNAVSDTAIDNILVNIKDESGADLVHSDGIPLHSLAQIVASQRFKGWLFARKQKISVTFTAATFPSSAKMTANYSCQITFAGYRLRDVIN